MDNIRPCLPQDLPGVADLFRKTFRCSQQPAPESLRTYFRDLYFHHPWQDERCCSLVYETREGQIGGFIGALPMRLRLDGQCLLAAVAGKFMIDSTVANPMAGARLLRSLLQGGQDLTISDTANETSRRMWEAAGGTTCFSQSLLWVRPLRPTRLALAMLAHKPMGDPLRFVLKCPAAVADRLAAMTLRRLVPPPCCGYVDADLSMPELLRAIRDAGQSYALRPDYDQQGLEWLIAQASQVHGFGPLHRRAVRDAAGRLVGWYMYYGCSGGVARVLQLGAAPHAHAPVIDSLLHHAWRLGASAVEARISTASVPILYERGGLVLQRRPFVVAHARSAAVIAALQRGDAFFSRLEGEWWTQHQRG